MNNQKKTTQIIKFNLPVGEAKPGPVLAPILGQSQINIQGFCKDFIDLTTNLLESLKLPVKIQKFSDKSFKVDIQCPSLNYIYEQIVMSRNSEKNVDFTYITLSEIKDILEIQRTFFVHRNSELLGEPDRLKLLLGFFQTKKIKIIL
jgi:ribosomal protein L11